MPGGAAHPCSVSLSWDLYMLICWYRPGLCSAATFSLLPPTSGLWMLSHAFVTPQLCDWRLSDQRLVMELGLPGRCVRYGRSPRWSINEVGSFREVEETWMSTEGLRGVRATQELMGREESERRQSHLSLPECPLSPRRHPGQERST